MEDMNSFELETFLKMILEILNGCENIEEAKAKIKALLERETSNRTFQQQEDWAVLAAAHFFFPIIAQNKTNGKRKARNF